MKCIKENEKGTTYQCDNFKILYRYKNSISGDNNINPSEKIYFITGSDQITLKHKTWNIKSPTMIKIPAHTYHKIHALTDISFIIFES